MVLLALVEPLSVFGIGVDTACLYAWSAYYICDGVWCEHLVVQVYFHLLRLYRDGMVKIYLIIIRYETGYSFIRCDVFQGHSSMLRHSL